MQVIGAQCRSVVHNIALYHWSAARCRFNKPKQKHWQTLPTSYLPATRAIIMWSWTPFQSLQPMEPPIRFLHFGASVWKSESQNLLPFMRLMLCTHNKYNKIITSCLNCILMPVSCKSVHKTQLDGHLQLYVILSWWQISVRHFLCINKLSLIPQSLVTIYIPEHGKAIETSWLSWFFIVIWAIAVPTHLHPGYPEYQAKAFQEQQLP